MLIVDTGVIVAAADRRDPHHAASRDIINSHSGELHTTAMVIAEAAYLIERELGCDVEALLFDNIARGVFHVEELTRPDWADVAQLVRQYEDLPLGGTDAGLVVLANRHQQTRIATLDRRHFSIVKPEVGAGFELLP